MRELAPDVRLRKMALSDLPAVMAIEHQAFSNPWSTEMVRKELSQDWSTVLVVEEATPAGWQLRAFAIFWLVADEVHVLNVATDGAVRRRGFGRQVMEAVLATGKTQKCRLATLEVRRSNEAALALYGSLGFRAVGMRPSYYQDNKEDAVIMILDL
ncbi:MAG: ribosomal protein S18-alanine N-acetyltransferase [Archangium sp.]|nr:ribosomal protein S18-alanine N-acetyltransferase [Archangium sp.]MDP3575164.1 ribosomal protein S18-alanine N-acetyltransferase [Archangium sp.]